jgi:hypothetical protein
MKCFYCKKEIDEFKPHKVTAPDGDVFHENCLIEYEKERDVFFNEIIHSDDKFNKWLCD